MAAIFLPSSPFPQIYSQQTEIVFSTHLHFAMILETFKSAFPRRHFPFGRADCRKNLEKKWLQSIRETAADCLPHLCWARCSHGRLFFHPMMLQCEMISFHAGWGYPFTYDWIHPPSPDESHRKASPVTHIFYWSTKVVYDYMFWIYTNCRALESSRIFTIYKCEQWLVYKNSLRSHKVE